MAFLLPAGYDRVMKPAGHPDISWNQAPRLARWWAMYSDGLAHWYCAPDVAAFTDFWFSDRMPAPTFGYTGDYKQSLTERPAK